MCRLPVYLLLMPLAFALTAGLQIETYAFDGIPKQWYDTQVPAPFKQIGNKFYYFEVKKKGSWWEALANCRKMNANLVTVESEEEINLIFKTLRLRRYDPTNYYWTSAHDEAKHGTFVSTTSGYPLTYLKWTPGNPDNYNDIERCMLLWVQRSDISMNDFDCIERCNYICEKEVPKTISFTFW